MEGFSKLPKMQHFKTGGSVKEMCYGGKMKNGGHAEKTEMKKDVAQDKKMIKKAVAMHDKQAHAGEKTDLTKLRKGGRAKKDCGTVRKYKTGGGVKKYSEGKQVDVKDPQKLVDQIALEENTADAAIIPNALRSLKNMATKAGKRLFGGQGAMSDKERDVSNINKRRGGKVCA